MDIQLHETRIARRGKGAKGSVTVQTIGKPVVKDGETVARSFDYSDIEKMPETEVLEFLRGMGNIAVMAAIGADAILRKSAIASQSQASVLRMELIKEGLATKDNVKAVAAAMVTAHKQMGMSFADLKEARRKMLKK